MTLSHNITSGRSWRQEMFQQVSHVGVGMPEKFRSKLRFWWINIFNNTPINSNASAHGTLSLKTAMSATRDDDNFLCVSESRVWLLDAQIRWGGAYYDSLLQQSFDYEMAALAKFKLAQGQTNP